MFPSARAQVLLIATLALPLALPAQDATHAAGDCADTPMMMDHAGHTAGMMMPSCGKLPTAPGQAAYAVIQEVVKLLQADSSTDWSRVSIEALRQHLIDMDEVTMRSTVSQRAIPAGMEARVTGTGRTAAAIRRMLPTHAAMLNMLPDYRASTVLIPGGVLLRVSASDSADTRLVARIRGLGFAGLLTEGDHHAAHHLALARGSLKREQ